jgi:integrase
MTISTLIDHYVRVKTLHAPMAASLTDKVGHIRRVFGTMAAASTGESLVMVANLAWAGLAPGTIKRYLVQLRAVMSRAYKDGLIARSPVIDVPYVNDTVYVDISGTELNLLLDYIKWTSRPWYALTVILAHTGARLGEALTLTHESFTRHGTRIAKRVDRRSKTIDRVIPYTPRLLAMVATSAIFSNGSITPPGIEAGSVPTCLGRVLDGATAALGLPRLRVHDLRHAFAAVLAENGADIPDLVTALGHSSAAMSMRYRGLVKTKLTGIMGKV